MTNKNQNHTKPHLPLDGHKWQRQRVGILGGSFNPPHKGHIHISLVAQKMLQLDYIWWLVTPQNPMKKDTKPESYADRFDSCLSLTQSYPSIIISDFENRMGLTYTADTVEALTRCYSKTEFVLLMGMDNALEFHKWQNWRAILDKMTTAHIVRPPFLTMVESCPLKQTATQQHIFLERSRKVKLEPRTSYWIMQNHLMDVSSTKIRNKTDR